MPVKFARRCPLCVYPRYLKNLSQHLHGVHRVDGQERKYWLRQAKSRHSSCDHRTIDLVQIQNRREQKKIYDSAESWIERLELEKRNRKFDKVCQDAIVDIVFDLFSTEYGFEMMEEKHEPRETFEEEMLLAFDTYWESWTKCKIIDNVAAIEMDYVLQLVEDYVKRFKWCKFREISEENVDNTIDRQLKFFWTSSSGRNLLKTKVTAKLLRDETKDLKHIYLDCARGVFKDPEL